MKFVAIIEYGPDKTRVDQFRPEHRAYCAKLRDAGQLAASGPLTDGFGGLFIYECDSIEAAEQIIKDDPFHREGVFAKWTIRPWTIAVSNPELF
jgi:uncharacterized protein YciI